MTKFFLGGLLFFCYPLLLCSCATAPLEKGTYNFTLSQSSVEKAKQKNRELPQNHFDYALFVPKKAAKESLRFILALHGAGERHEDYFLKWQREAVEHNTIIVAPQLEWPVPLTTEYLKHFIDFIEDLSRSYPIDPKRVYVAGASAGGAVGLHLAVDYPEQFRGAVMISSLGFDQCLRTENKLERIKDFKSLPPLLFVHGMKDTQLYETVLNGMTFLQEHDIKPQLVSYTNAGHEHRPEWNKRIFQWIENLEQASSLVSKNAG